jgi:hypothetical protein
MWDILQRNRQHAQRAWHTSSLTTASPSIRAAFPCIHHSGAIHMHSPIRRATPRGTYTLYRAFSHPRFRLSLSACLPSFQHRQYSSSTVIIVITSYHHRRRSSRLPLGRACARTQHTTSTTHRHIHPAPPPSPPHRAHLLFRHRDPNPDLELSSYKPSLPGPFSFSSLPEADTTRWTVPCHISPLLPVGLAPVL